MDKELDSIADDIIKDSFGSAAPTAPEMPTAPKAQPAPEVSPSMPEARPSEPARPSSISSGDPFLNHPPKSAPATPRETFTAEIPRKEIPKRPLGNAPKERTNEYNRIKEQMSAARDAREASGMSNPTDAPSIISMAPDNMPKQGLNKAILLFIILIPVVVVAAGVIIALLNQPTTNNSSNSQNTDNQTKYIDPRDTAEKIDLSTYTADIKIEKPGHYILSGTTNFPIKVNADGEVTLYLHNISVTATDASALSNFSHNHLVIYMDDGTENTLAVKDPNTFDSIYSEGDLTIDGGTGILNVTGIKIADGHHYDVTGNGIKDTKNVVITPTEGQETPAGETTPENPENSTATQPAEGSSELQPTQPAEPTAQPTEPAPAETTPTTR
ncbi:MAG: carbohydrate-binding domain-containing protein [Candidatus Saccharibacteria bacterium]|nr:carbohydrate-binding domain-containing protein [Candidatus Saccharibacteria bacterium]